MGGLFCNTRMVQATLIGNNVEYAANLLKSGSVVAVPTETVYGLAGNALNEKAVAAIFEAKNRPFFDPLIVHIGHEQHLENLAMHVPDDAKKLIEQFWPGPLTLVLPKTNLVPHLVTSGLAHVAVRMPAHDMMRSLLLMLDFPLAAPSANLFGSMSPTNPQHVLQQLQGRIPYILDGGPCVIGVESTIVAFHDDGVSILREGGVSREELGTVVRLSASRATLITEQNPIAPGMLHSHYAPSKPVILLSDSNGIPEEAFTLISMGDDQLATKAALYINLSDTTNLREAAANFFSAMYRADETDAQLIVIRKFPEIGLGRALNDRAQRAAVKRNF